MTDLLEKAIAQVKQLPEAEQNEVAKMILEKLKSKDKLTKLFEKIDELGEDPSQPSMEKITSMVKEVRHSLTQK
ncbi:unknown [Crocosphaera subtropica ATCC 51142]|uniref:Uncharacterized protein n=1 Tax=Crocosphaera subtropica (strain ATCC 51142 / BH68) TaxID=43989 RepID=B1X2Q1_CROS5|nr:hypothetical protein [Crocosphaera subtropica]ACB54412.1 unknown [Crocosphaera subtropica ATCC 51142]